MRRISKVSVASMVKTTTAAKAKMPGERLSQRPGSLSRAVTDMTGIEVSHHTRDRSGPQFPGK